MKNILIIGTFVFVLITNVFSQSNKDFESLEFNVPRQKADSVLKLMTLKEKINYIGGDHFFYTQEIKRLNIPSVSFVDATQGIRINPAIICKGFKKPIDKSVAYPSPILLTATWNPELAYRYAYSIGEECQAANLPVLLGPGLNIYRNAQCGRNFEYMGEDPFLAGTMVAKYVTGLQETGTIATLKHFIANQSDFYRKKSNSIVEERALHEIYMPAFKAGIEAGAKAVMTSYNLVNGEWAGQSDYVINQLLREDLVFNGLVMTDWFSVWDGEKLIQSGQDLEMPFRSATKHADKLIKDGKISEAEIDRMVKRILFTFYSMGSFEGEKNLLTETDYNRLKTVALITAREGMVLLKNDLKTLPIDKTKNQKILVTGEYLKRRIGGGGAGYVKGFDIVLLKEAFQNEFGNQITFAPEPSVTQIKDADIVLLTVGTRDSEGADRPFNLPDEQESLVQMCTKNNPNTVVIVTSGGGINMSRWIHANTILYTWYMGQNGATAVAEILSGKVNPSGKLPISIEKHFEDSPAFGYIPNGEELYKGFKIRAEKKHPVFDVNYEEGIFVGYRWYEHKNIEPQFCFGHGLSYSTFDYKALTISSTEISKSDTLDVSITVENTGEVDGAEVIQLYLTDKACSVERPVKELKGFQKIFLKAGESKEVNIKICPNDFAFWHPETKAWTIEEGEFEIKIGASSGDIRLTKTVIIK